MSARLTHSIISVIIIKTILIKICVQETAPSDHDIEAIFNKTADDLFNEKIGDIAKQKDDLSNDRWMNIQQFLLARESFRANESLFEIPDDTTTTEKNEVKMTLSSKVESQKPEITMKDIRMKMKKLEINTLLRQGRVRIPNFNNDEDDPNQLTKHFDLNITIPKDTRRVFYHQVSSDDPKRLYEEKLRLSYIMIQFIYMTRRQMSYMTVVRNKYKNALRYKIGYLFGMFRMVRQHQSLLFKVETHHYKYFTNAQLSLQFYYRIVMLGVDIQDIMRYILKLNYLQNLASDPKYYWDSMEYYGYTTRRQKATTL